MKQNKYAVRLNKDTSRYIDFSSGDSLIKSKQGFTISKYKPSFSVVQYKRKNQYQFGKYHEPHWSTYGGQNSLLKSEYTKEEATEKFKSGSKYGVYIQTEWKAKPQYSESEIREKAFNKVTHMTGCWFNWVTISSTGKSTQYEIPDGEKEIDNKNSLGCYNAHMSAYLFFENDSDFKEWYGEDNWKNLIIDMI